MKIVVSLILVILGLSICIFAQTAGIDGPPSLREVTKYSPSDDFVVGEVKGRINTKPVYLAKPEYPVDAMQAGIEGSVRVRFTLDEAGQVINVETLEGNQMLKKAAEDAARRSKFRIPRDPNGQAVKDSGTLAYAFEIKKAGWSRIAFELTALDRAPVSAFTIPPARKAFDPSWTDEFRILEELDEIRRAEPAATWPPARPKIIAGPVQTVQGRTIARIASGMAVIPMQPALNPNQAALAQSLIRALQARLDNDKLNSWQFSLGLNLRKALELYRNPYERFQAADIIDGLIKNKPDGVSPEVLKALNDIEKNFETQKLTWRLIQR